jgi:hypothetical protein
VSSIGWNAGRNYRPVSITYESVILTSEARREPVMHRAAIRD